MTDAEKYVRTVWPNAVCHRGKQYWPGQGTREGYMITRAPIMSSVDGFGQTEIEAWASAANGLAAQAEPKGETK